MNKNLNDLIKRYTIKYDRKIKNICDPLKNHLQIPHFYYYSIEEDGHFGIIGNYPEQLEFYYHENFYLNEPYLIHPKFLRTGCVIVKSVQDPLDLKIYREKFFVEDLFIMIKKTARGFDGFIFSDPNLNEQNSAKYIHNLELLQKFTNHFKREAQPILKAIWEEKYNIHSAKGDAFLKSTPSLPLYKDDNHIQGFINALLPLTKRERQCLECYQKGHTSQATGAMLGISQRTVEHYFESIKNKLRVSSKRDLLDF